VDRLNHPHVKLLADLYHVEAEKEPFVNIAAAGKRLAHIHLATPSIPATGTGIDYDMHGYIAAVRKAGYDGRMTVEDNPGLLGKKEPPLTEVYRAVLEYVKSCV
jgi:sugar phosphate isomerase/epimerase